MIVLDPTEEYFRCFRTVSRYEDPESGVERPHTQEQGRRFEPAYSEPSEEARLTFSATAKSSRGVRSDTEVFFCERNGRLVVHMIWQPSGPGHA